MALHKLVLLSLLMRRVPGLLLTRATIARRASSLAATPQLSSQYEFLDCGNQRRLERFGEHLVCRNCPSALWAPGLPLSSWEAATLKHDGSKWTGGATAEGWRVVMCGDLAFELAPSEQGQVGIFPEQQEQWEWIRRVLAGWGDLEAGADSEQAAVVPRVLNGFAYTGGSTMAALSGHRNVNVTHLDASSSAINWASRNVAAAGWGERPVRFIADDCLTFLRREVKRGKKYEGLIFDPPAFGRGGGSKIWKLKKDMPSLVDLLSQLLSDRPAFLLLTCHDPDWSAKDLRALLQSQGLPKGQLESGEMSLVPPSGSGGKALPLGCFVRVSFR